MKYPQAIVAASRLRRRDPMFDAAPCAGRWFETDLPRDSNRMRRDELARFMAPALALCAECPFTRECLDLVQPRESYYDGVAGGHLFRNGMCVTDVRLGRPRYVGPDAA